MPKLRPSALLAALLALTVLNMPGVAGAGGFDQFVVFGDSTLDTGYFRYHTSGNQGFNDALDIAIQFGATGGWAGNGVMNTTILAEKFGLTAASIDNGGSNYANGGATTMNDNGAMVPNNIYTIQQIRNYLANVNGAANPNALYLIKTGDNDATWVTSNGPAWIAANANYLNTVAASIASEVATLQAAGARTIVVRNSYDSALFAQ
jgi:outer membrane lipase/esterase